MLVYQRVFGQGLEDGPPQHTIQTVPPGNRKRSSGKHVRSPWAWHAHGQPPARVEGAGSDRVLKARMEPPQKGTSTFQTSEMEFVLISCMLWQPQALAAPIIPTYIYTVYIYIYYIYSIAKQLQNIVELHSTVLIPHQPYSRNKFSLFFLFLFITMNKSGTSWAHPCTCHTSRGEGGGRCFCFLTSAGPVISPTG